MEGSLSGRGRVAAVAMIAALLATGPLLAPRHARAAAATPWGTFAPPSATLFGASADPDPGTAAPDEPAATIADLEQLAGRKMDLDRHAYAWDAQFPGPDEQTDVQQGRLPMIEWAGTHLDDVLSGSQDALIAARAQAVRAMGVPVFLSWGARMNDGANQWSGPQNNDAGQENGPQKFVAAWQRIHDAFAAVGATNAIWIWTPASASAPAEPWNSWSAYYPGDGYVDWVGVNGINWGNTRTPNTWTTFDDVVGGLYGSYTGSKPVLVETGSVASGGSLADWIRTARASIRLRFPHVAALVWLPPTPAALAGTPAAADAFREMGADPRFDLLSAGVAPGTPYPLTDARASGVRGDGVTDDTAALAHALAGGGKVVLVPAGSYLISGQLDVPSDTTLWFAPGATLLGAVRDWQGDSMVYLYGVHDVTVVGGVLDGRMDANPEGYLYGLTIEGPPNARVRVQGTTARDMPPADYQGGNGGDGFYLDSGTDIRFDSVVADGNYRQGLSITGSVQNVVVVDSVFENTVGANPGGGIDIEPNPGEHTLTGIRVIRSRFVGNNWGFIATLANDADGRMSGLHILGSTFSNNRRDGLFVSSNGSVMDDVLVAGSTVQGNGNMGIYLVDQLRVLLQADLVTGNLHHGIMLERNVAGARIRFSHVVRNDGFGLYILNSNHFHVGQDRMSLNGRDGIRVEYTGPFQASGFVRWNRMWNNGVSDGGVYDGMNLNSAIDTRCTCLVAHNVLGNDDRGPWTQRNGITVSRRLHGVLLRYNRYRSNLHQRTSP